MVNKTAPSKAKTWKRLLPIVLLAIVLYAILPQLQSFHASLTVIKTARVSWLAAAFLFSLATYVAAALVYLALARSRLRFWPTLIVEGASSFANRLLPAGIGAIGVGYEYLRRHKHSAAAASAVVATNNLLGFVGNIGLLLLALLLPGITIHDLRLPHVPVFVWLGLAPVVIIAFIVLRAKTGHWLRRSLQSIGLQLISYRHNPARLVIALLASMLLTTCYVLCLYSCGQAIGLELSVATALICMTVGVAGGTIAPTPGGLGGVEAGLVASLVVVGANASTALAVALLFRVMTYWLPLIFGGLAFGLARRRQYI